MPKAARIEDLFSENPTGKFLKDDGTWDTPPGGGTPPTGTGWRHVTAGVEDSAASTPTYTDVGAAASGHNHSGTYEPADTAIQTHVTGTGSPHTPAGIGAESANSNIQTHVTGTGSPHTAAGVGALASTAFVGVSKITVGTSQPGSPTTGDLWVDTN